MAHALLVDDGQQLPLYERPAVSARAGRAGNARLAARVRVCAACRSKEARYGFRDEETDPIDLRPRTLCFACFGAELGRRQVVAERRARGWNATQVDLPLAVTLDRLDRRRRRAQIAARHALELR